MYKQLNSNASVKITALVYFGYFVAATIALVMLGEYPEDESALEYAFIVVFLTSGLHFAFHIFVINFGSTSGLSTLDRLYPIKAQSAFLYADFIMSCALGATISAYILDHSNRTPVVVGNAVVLATQSVCAWKTLVLLNDCKMCKVQPS
jgi:hypothetical protein